MALPPQKFREIILQLLYSQDITPIDIAEFAPFMMHELKVTRRTMLDVHDRVNKILEKCPEIDRKIANSSTSYSFERISQVEKAILRLGAFELLFDAAIPVQVVIAEAIRLSRKFGTPEGGRFVNAILDDIYRGSCKTLRTQKTDDFGVPCESQLADSCHSDECPPSGLSEEERQQGTAQGQFCGNG